MQTTNGKGATNGKTKTAAVAKDGATNGGDRKPVSAVRRQGATNIPVGTEPVRYRFTRGDRGEIQQGPLLAGTGAEEQEAESPPQGSYTGPSIKTLTRLATLGLVLLGFVIGVIVGRVWL